MKLITYFSMEKYNFLLFPSILFFICLVILVQTYVPGTWLSGWDTLHPEFDFLLNFKRLFFGVFRQEQGLGAVAAHSHMSDIPRVLFLWISSIIIPINLLRFFYIALCLPIGVIGTYFFIKNIILENIQEAYKRYFSFLGALFYLFNLGTLQHFYVPFEMFTTAYAFIPWLFLQAANFIKESSKKSLFIFALLSLISSPMAYAALLWYSYFLSLLLFLLFFGKKHYRQVTAILIVAILVNSFWILPNLYFLLSGNASQVPLAKINKIFSDEAFLYNKSYGNLKDALIFKNFLFDWPVYSGNGQFDFLLSVWKNHLANPAILILGYVLSITAILGIIQQFLKGGFRNKSTKALIFPTLICLIFIVNSSPFLDIIFSYLRNNFSIFREAFRFPFTKFSIFLILGFSCFFSIGSLYIYNLILKVLKVKDFSNRVLIFQTVITIFILTIFMWPLFKGEIISPKMFVKIPNEYFQTFEYLKKEDENVRVSFLPAQTFWGWLYYDFGFQGAQFITFGIKQPVMDRDFDRWNLGNEQYYREYSYAIYSQNPMLLEKVLEKYNVGFLILDENIIAPDTNQYRDNLYLDQIKLLLKSTSFLVKQKQFNKITIYKFTRLSGSEVEGSEGIVDVSQNYNVEDIDWAYLNYGNYVQNNQATSKIEYPILNFGNNQNLYPSDSIFIKDSKINLKVNTENKNFKVKLNEILNAEVLVPAKIYTKKENGRLIIKFNLQFTGNFLDDNTIYYTIPLALEENNQEELLLNIDKYQVVKIRNLKAADFTYQGSIYLSTNTYNNLAIVNPLNFSNSQKNIAENFTLNSSDKSKFSINMCNAPDEDQIFSVGTVNTENSGFNSPSAIKIAAKNSRACVWIPLNKVLDATDLKDFKTLIQFKFNTVSKNDVIGRYCIYDKSLERCVKGKKYIIHDTQIEDYFSISVDDLDKLELVMYLDGLNNRNLEEIEYSNLILSSSKPSYVFSISSNDLSQVLAGKTINLNDKDWINISYPQDLLVESFNLLESGHEKGKCSNLDTKDFDRKVNKSNGYIEYSAKKGSSCDFFSFPNLDHNLGYFVFIENKNLEGLPLRICAANPYSKRCDAYLSLPYNKEFKQDVIMLPPLADGGVGYDIHFDNYAVGNIKSINQVKDLKIVPFPYFWLKSQHSQNNSSGYSNIKAYSNQILPGIIKVNFSKIDQNLPGLLVLNHSFEKGWWMPSSRNVKVNGWANGFLVNENSSSKFIIFWPQIIEYIGFMIMAIILTWLSYINFSSKFRNFFKRDI